jgi:chaperonin GroES
MKLIPVNNYILIKPLERERKTKSGLYYPDSEPNMSLTAKVISVSEKRTDKDGKEIPHICKEGDIIVHKNYGLSSIEYNEEEHFLFNENEVMGVIK